MGNRFAIINPIERVNSNFVLPVRGIQKYARMEIDILNVKKKIHGFLPGMVWLDKNNNSIIHLIEKSIEENSSEFDIFFENSTLVSTDPDSITTFADANESRLRFYEINESSEIFKQRCWKSDLFLAIRSPKYSKSEFEILFTSYLSRIQLLINNRVVYDCIQKLKKKMYNTIKQYNTDYPTKEELKWIFDPITTICFIFKIYSLNSGIYKIQGDKESKRVGMKNIIIISKNLDNRVNELIHLFGGIIEYSYTNNAMTSAAIPIPICRKNRKYCLPHFV